MPDIVEVECNVVVKASGGSGRESKPDRDRKCSTDAKDWHKDTVCSSPITKPEKDCMPHR